MAKKNSKKSTLGTKEKVGIGVGLTAAAVAAAGAYFLAGSKNAKQNRRKVKSWMLKAKAEVLEALETAEEMTEREFNDLIEGISKTYGKVKDASQADIREFKKEMKEHWPMIVKEGKQIKDKMTGKASAAKKTVKKATKKAVKKATKKVAKK